MVAQRIRALAGYVLIGELLASVYSVVLTILRTILIIDRVLTVRILRRILIYGSITLVALVIIYYLLIIPLAYEP